MSDRVEMTIASADLPPHIQFVAVRQEAMKELLRIDVNGAMTVGTGLSADEATQTAAKMLVDEFTKAYNTEIACLRAELSRLSALVAWQDIETAPRDGRYVWLWNKHADHPADAPQRFFWSTHYSVFGLGGCWTNGLATMGDKIDFDFWCEFLPAGFLDPYAPAPPVSQLKDTTNADK